MSRRTHHIPKYGLHKPSGQARVIINGEHFYLGRYGSPESREKYARLIAELAVSPESVSKSGDDVPNPSDILVCELIARYLTFAKSYYVQEGDLTKEFTEMILALRPVNELYATTEARRFGPLSLKAVRKHMVDECDLSRGVVNLRVNRIKRFFKWAVSEELVPPAVHEGLRTVTGLKYGRTNARETDPVKPVEEKWVVATLPSVAPQVRAMIQIQWLVGMRPGDVVVMRPIDIDMNSDVWIYEPDKHKNTWRGHPRRLPIGPKAQAVLAPFLDGREATEYIFSPREAEAWRNAERRKRRKTPMTPSQATRKRKQQPKKEKRHQYDTDSYRRAIKYGIKKANKKRDSNAQIPDWYPLQIRHSRGTEVRSEFGLEAAQVVLGHKRADVTEIYAERDMAKAMEVARKTG